MKAWRVYDVYEPENGVWVHAPTSNKAKSLALQFDLFDYRERDTYISLRANRAPYGDDKPLTMDVLKGAGCYLLDFDEETSPSTEADWPIECRCEICKPAEEARWVRCLNRR